MASKVLKKILINYLTKLAEPKIKELTGKEVKLELYGAKKYVEGLTKYGKVYIDTEPYTKDSIVYKIIRHYIESGLKFLGEDPSNYDINIDVRDISGDLDEGDLPFDEEEDGYGKIRTFNENINPSELKWHVDNEDRVVTVIQNQGWELQMDNELPVKLIEGYEYHIPKNIYHRVIKGNGNLKVRVTFI